jgi:hypothetical protein
VDDLFLRSNRAVSVEPNLITGGNGHYRSYLSQQKSLPNESSTSITNINRQFISSETMDQSIISARPSEFDNPAFTMRRYGKEDNIQLEQMKKVNRIF